MKQTIKQLSEEYGTLDLLVAYLMRMAKISEEEAEDLVYNIDFTLEQLLIELQLNGNC